MISIRGFFTLQLFVPLIFILSIIYNSSLYAQVVVQGQIVDIDNVAIPFASVYLKKSKEGINADESGKFVLHTKDIAYTRDSMIVSFLGYRSTSIGLDLTQNSKHKIILHKSEILLDEFNLEEKKKKVLSALQIVKKTISNLSDNNVNTAYTTEGFYRELVRENDKAIKVNEAAIRFNFSSYPQKRGYKSGFKKFWSMYNDYYRALHQMAGFPRLSQHYGYYNTKSDAAKILGSRFSNQLGNFKSSVNPAGGPLDLTGNDKLKFQYDFFHAKRFSDYIYKKEGVIEDKGEWCYLISFRPKKDIKGLIHHNWSKKMEYAVYSGEMLISVNDFVVHRINCERGFLNKPSNYYFNRFQFISSQLELNYGATDKGWILTNVSNKQIITVETNGRKDKFEVIRTLNISDSIINENKEEYPWDECLDLTTVSTIEDFTKSYDEQFWKDYETGNLFEPLSVEDVKSLEQKQSLNKQYSEQFTPIDLIPVPKAQKVSDYLSLHNNSLADNYRWMEDKSDETVKYVKEENDYYNKVMRQVKKYRNEYISMYNAVLIRDTLPDAEELFNTYKLVRKSVDDSLRLFRVLEDSSRIELFNYRQLVPPNIFKNLRLSLNLSYLAYSYNMDYGFTYTMIINEINQKRAIDTISSVSDFHWLNDSILVYTTSNLPGRYPSNAAYYYNAHTQERSLLFAESDDPLRIEIKTSQSNEIAFIQTTIKNVTSTFVLNQNLQVQKLLGIVHADLTQIEHFFEGTIYYVTDYNQLYAVPIIEMSKSIGKLVFSGKEAQTIREFNETSDYIVLTILEGGTVKLITISKKDGKQAIIKLDKMLCSIDLNEMDYAANTCLIGYESALNPYIQCQIDLKTKEKKWKRTEGKLSNVFKPDFFEFKQVFAKTKDRKKIPITYLNRKYIKKKKGTILRVYGAYGAMRSPTFSEEDLAFAQLGFTVAYAHVRGGIYNGKKWYTDGIMYNKQNGINDYIDCANYLIDNGLATDSTLIGIGVSAGGVIVGAAINQAPELFNTVILDRPFLDVLTIQSNASLPLTIGEYYEVGNPNILKDYKYISTYCPYQNIKPNNYPNILYLGGMNDWNVNYWNPLKHLVSIRENNLSSTKQLIHLSETTHIIPYSKGIADNVDIYGFIMYNLTKTN